MCGGWRLLCKGTGLSQVSLGPRCHWTCQQPGTDMDTQRVSLFRERDTFGLGNSVLFQAFQFFRCFLLG